jgi:GDP-L-fucose synthase
VKPRALAVVNGALTIGLLLAARVILAVQRTETGRRSHTMTNTSRIFVAGHRGLVGSAILRRLDHRGYEHILTATRDQLDLRDQSAVNYWFRANRPDYVYLVAGTVGGIIANSTRPAEFIYDNMMIHATVVHSAHLFGTKKLLYLGSSCIYPRLATQPMKEEELLSGPLEPTNESYAIAKIAGIKLCQSYRKQYGSDFISAMPTNLYGPNDNFDLTASHVLPAMIRKFHDAREEGRSEVVIWGTGSPKREFLHVDDLADACVFLMNNYSEPGHINVGTGEDQSIADLAQSRTALHGNCWMCRGCTRSAGVIAYRSPKASSIRTRGSSPITLRRGV